MKHLKTGIICLLATICCFTAPAQTIINPPGQQSRIKKPRLFTNIPERVAVAPSKLFQALALKKGQVTSIDLSDKFTFKGTVTAAVSKYNDAIQSIVIKSTDYPDATFTISKFKKSDGTVVYRGRIMSFTHGDCFELKTENGQFILVKKNFEDMVND